MTTSDSVVETREWVIYKTQTHTTVYTGITAESREEALASFLEGDGELQQDREKWSEWALDAVDIRKP